MPKKKPIMYKNYALLFFVFMITIACNSEQSDSAKLIIGKWKIYQTKMSGKDITKRSDPKNENGLNFKNAAFYESFGNPGHQDEGTYNLSPNGKTLLLTSDNTASSSSAMIDLQGDTLKLEFVLDEHRKLEMSLYRME